MAIDFASDLDAIFDTDEHAQTATYIRQGYPSIQIPVILDSEYSVTQGVDEPGMGLPSPQVLCKTADVANAFRGDTFVVGGTTYYVQEVQPDGTGVTTLILSRDPL
jgi:hypothetical protein